MARARVALLSFRGPLEWNSGASDEEKSSEEDLSWIPSEGEEEGRFWRGCGPSAPAAASAGPERRHSHVSAGARTARASSSLELTMLSLTVRLRQVQEPGGTCHALRDCTEESKNVKTVACKKCSNQMSIGKVFSPLLWRFTNAA